MPRQTTTVLFMHVMLLAGACTGRHDAAGRDGADAGADGGPASSGGMMSRHAPMMGGGARADTGAAPRATATATAAAGTCPGTGQALVDEGRLIFGGTGNCFACHGAGAAGASAGPDLTDARWLNIDGSYASIITLVRDGVSQPKQYPVPMPAMGGAQLSDEQVCAVAAYVYALHPR